MFQELFDESGEPRAVYAPLFRRINASSRTDLRRLDEQLEATMREMGVTFDIARDRPWGRRPWFCDLLPQVFTAAEWKSLGRAMTQRMQAYECFLRDVYSDQRVLRSGVVPLQPVLGSPHYQRAAAGLRPPGDAFLHLSGMALARQADGRMVVKHHYFSHASGISYMIQNRRAMARVMPEAFVDYSIHSIADTPIAMMEILRGFSHDADPTVVLLSSGQGSAVYSEHSFLARRMGIPLVQGGDLLVLNDHVYLKTVEGLEKVEVIYSRISDQWLDPLVFRRDSMLGVPGLVQCIRQGTVSVINAVGAQLVDDRALLPFAPAFIRYYLGETPLLDGLETLWLGDIDQREMVLGDLENYVIRPIYGERVLTPWSGKGLEERRRKSIVREVSLNPAGFVAQARGVDAATLCYDGGYPTERFQDHIIFGLRRGEGDYSIFPGSLTRITGEQGPSTASELGGGSKDSWVQASPGESGLLAPRIAPEVRPPSQLVTSRVAESFYWTGRYLERARALAGMIGVIEALETEELNVTERNLYRPVWNRMLPPLEGEGGSRRTISNVGGRFRLALDLKERGSVVSLIQRATWNGESVLECLSMESWSVLSQLQARFERARVRRNLSDPERAALTRKVCDYTTDLVAQFFGTSEMTMIADGGWRFCEIGVLVERAVVTSNAVASMARSLVKTCGPSREHARELQLSAFLRLLGCRDAYRRVYQMRVEAGAVLRMLYQNPVAPRSVKRCLSECRRLLGESQPESGAPMQRTVAAIELFDHEMAQTDWERLVETEIERPEDARPLAESELVRLVDSALAQSLAIHDLVSDGFLNHQIHMSTPEQPMLAGFSSNAI
ncbi:MAG: circularly permuted type 2 ATP-grasp protein [Chthoniobacterales bacterium]